MKLIACFAAVTLELSLSFGANAQSAVWGTVDCSTSRLVVPPGARCEATNLWVARDGHGQFQSWNYVTRTPYQHVWMQESLSSISHLVFRNTAEEYLRLANARAKEATSFSARSHRDNADYYTFTAKGGEKCTGFRRGGPSRSAGYMWAMGGVMCLPNGQSLDQARVFEFLDSAKVK